MQQLHVLFLHVVVARSFPESCMHFMIVFNELLLYPEALGVDLLPADGCLLVMRRLLLIVLVGELSQRDEILWQRILLFLDIS